MRSRAIFLTSAALIFSALAAGQDSAKKASPDTTPPGSVEVRFTDGGHLRMTISTEYLDFVTAHGKLKIAVADIRRLDLATRISEADQRLIEKSIADLG